MSVHERIEKNKDIQFSCSHCTKSFKSEIGLNMHNTNYHKLERVTPKPDTTEYKCSDCDFFVIGRNRKLTKHVLEAHGKVIKINKKFDQEKHKACRFCPFVTANKQNLWIHENAVHLKSKIFKCGLCDFTTYYKAHLNIHKARHETMSKVKYGTVEDVV